MPHSDRLSLIAVPICVGAGLVLAAAFIRLGAIVATATWLAVIALVAALVYPYLVAQVVIVLGVFAAAYLQPVPPFSGPVLISIMLFASGVGVSLETRGRFLGSPMAALGIGLGILWLAGAILGGKPSEGVALTGFAVMAGVVQLAQTERGRHVALRGVALGSSIASCYGLAAVVTGRNPVLEAGLRAGAAMTSSDHVVMRFGYSRAVGAFTHPIMLGVFLGLGCLAALELARAGVWRERTAVLVVVVCFAGQIATISRGPITLTLGLVAIWFLLGHEMSMRSRVAGVVGIVVLVVAALGLIGMVGNVGTLFGTSAADPLANSTQYRFDLISSLMRRLPSAPLLGYANPDTAAFLPGFRSLDNEIAYLGASRGILGLVVFGLLVSVPLIGSLFRHGTLVVSKRYVVLSLVFICACGVTVAFFGLLMPYLFAVIALCWVAVAAPSPASPDNSPEDLGQPQAHA